VNKVVSISQNCIYLCFRLLDV